MKGCSCCRKQYGGSSKKMKHRITICLTMPHPEELKATFQRDYVQIHVHSRIAHNSQKEATQGPLMDAWRSSCSVYMKFNVNKRKEGWECSSV
jgi:hypothetical protein